MTISDLSNLLENGIGDVLAYIGSIRLYALLFWLCVGGPIIGWAWFYVADALFRLYYFGRCK